jgi:hypothetical protein
MASTDIYVAKESFATELDGQSVIVQKGTTRVRSGHALLKGRENMFELITVQYDVEQATAAPGEKRSAPAPAPEPVPEPAPEPEAETNAERRARVKAETKADEA